MTIFRAARLSDETVPLFRYTLTRIWEEGTYTLPIIMLNPSTADHEQDDPTIQTCMKFARRDGFGGIQVCNLLARRSPHPSFVRACQKDGQDVNGPDNDRTLRTMFEAAHGYGLDVWCAWGNGALDHMERVGYVFDLARNHGVRLIHAGTTGFNMPKHPLARGKHRIPADVVFKALEIAR